jgi:muramoyltetrapeptide carboxypeptidase
MIIPSSLQKGDTIGITSTARKIYLNELVFTIEFLEHKGFKVKMGSCIGLKDHQFAGTENERTTSINELIEDNSVKAILCARGGYGSVRIVDHINWNAFQEAPKWICGYSDVTVLHARTHTLGVASLHSTMPINFKTNTEEALESFVSQLKGTPTSLSADTHALNRTGIASGQLVGGNLSILYSLLGSKDQLDTTGKILFIEDLDEYLYHIDRMMQALKRAGMLDDLAGLVIGGMSDMNDNAIPFGSSAIQTIANAVIDYNYPVAFNFPVGHLNDNQTLTLGAEYELKVEEYSELIPKI